MDVRKSQRRGHSNDRQVHKRAVCAPYCQHRKLQLRSPDILRANAPLRVKPRSSRTNATRNWLSLPTVGTKGELDAACQTSSSDESIKTVEPPAVKQQIGMSPKLQEKLRGDNARVGDYLPRFIRRQLDRVAAFLRKLQEPRRVRKPEVV